MREVSRTIALIHLDVYGRLALLWALAGCARVPAVPTTETGAPVEGDGLVQQGVVVCRHPEDRVRSRFDPVVLLGTRADEARFWGGGATIGDFDLDGHLDVVLPRFDGIVLYQGDGRGGLTEDVTAFPPVDPYHLAAAAAGDAEGDGDLDLMVTRYGSFDTLLVNDGGSFHDGTATAGVAGSGGYSQGATWADLDADGDLDLVVAGHGEFDDSGTPIVHEGPTTPSRLYYNRGDGTFEDRSASLPTAMQDGYTFVPAVSDLDGDGALDLYFVNDFPMYRASQAAYARGTGWESVPGEVGLNVHLAGMGIGISDFNDDGVDDFVVPAWGATAWLESNPAGVWVDATQARGITRGPLQVVGWGAEVADLDDDGQQEVAVVFGYLDTAYHNPLLEPDALYVAQADGTWRDEAVAWGLADLGVGRGAAFGDLNEDGFLDVVTPDLLGPTRVQLSRCGEQAWLQVRLDDGGKNRAGVGAVVTVRANGVVQRRLLRAGGTNCLSQGPVEAHFGLGNAELAEITVTWGDGVVTTYDDVPTRQSVLARRGG